MMRIAILAVGFLFSTTAFAISVAVSSTIQPYVIKETDSGLHVSIIRAAFTESNIKPDFVYGSNKRLIQMLNSGTVDMVTHLKRSENKNVFYTAYPIESFSNTAVVLKRNVGRVQSVADLQGLRVGAWQNASLYLGADFQLMTKNNKRYSEFAGHAPSLMLVENRLDVMINEPNIFRYHLYEGLKGRPYEGGNMAYVRLFPEPNLYWWGFLSQALLKQFEAGLRSAYEKGFVDDIFQYYEELYGIERGPLWSLDCHYGGIEDACKVGIEVP